MSKLQWVEGIICAIVMALIIFLASEVDRVKKMNKGYQQEVIELQEYKDLYDKYGIGCET